MASPKPLIAFYGATGGSTLACVAQCLKAGFHCTALARTPAKLTQMLLDRDISQSAIDTHLTISSGDVLKISDVKAPLTLNGRSADIIISGIGITTLPISKVTICGDAVSNIISALKEMKPAKKPLLVVISSTGITKTGPRDVPLLFTPLYRLLHNPHVDKMRMEAVVLDEAKSAESVISNFVMVRPSLLMNGKALGGSKIRVGTDAKPAVGYTIARDDVGLWMFGNLVQGDNSRYLGETPSITY